MSQQQTDEAAAHGIVQFIQLALTATNLSAEWFSKFKKLGLNDGITTADCMHPNVPCLNRHLVFWDTNGKPIHANYAHTLKRKNRMICTQGPTKNSYINFWRMILATGSKVICMLCDFEKRVYKYYPIELGQIIEFEDVVITNTGVRDIGAPGATIVESQLTITHGTSTETIYHYHWRDWPDRSVPSDFQPFLKLLECIEDSDSPITIHCFGGIGRTGTLAAILMINDNLRAGRIYKDVDEIMLDIRDHRANAVQCFAQFLYVLCVVLLYLEKHRPNLWTDSMKEDFETLQKLAKKAKVQQERTPQPA